MIFRKKKDKSLPFDEDFEELFEVFYQHFNSKQREVAWCFVLARHGSKCYHCGKTFAELIKRAEIQEQLNDTKRKYPVVVLDNLINNGVHCNPDDTNLVPSCYPCNRNKDKFNTSQASEMSISRSKLDSLKHEPIYHHNLKTLLMDEQEVCFSELRMGGKMLSEGMNEVTTLRYFNSKKKTKVNKKGIYIPFAHNCGSEDCNGVHICLTGMIPKKLIKQEMFDLEKVYNMEYSDGNFDTFKHKTSSFGKTFIGFDEFFSQRTKLLKNFSNVEINEIKHWN